ncbi:hypothetical protein Zmor_026085 [Zophobas morio]|uniref:Uncharacterized protein n=1 Tax=Zophobas morio TaxID=2755281 RepID=A0AA38M498_9CUCU|nr:hypothetical protein Zmor_026085 [Zophobas morio]
MLSTVIKEAGLVYEKRIAGDKDTKTLFKHIRTTLTGPVKTVKVKDAAGMVTPLLIYLPIPLPKCLLWNLLSSVYNSNNITDIKFSADAVLDNLSKLKVTKSPGPILFLPAS